VFEDSYQKLPAGPGIHVNQMELLGFNNNWYCGGYLAAEGFASGTANLVHLTTNGSGSSSNTNCLTSPNNSYTYSWQLSGTTFDQAYHQFGIDYSPGVSAQFYGDGVLLGSTPYSAGFIPPNLSYGISPMYPVSNVAIGDAYSGGNPTSATWTNGNNIFSIKYIRIYKKVTSGACYSSIPAPGTIPHAGTC
jgi:hypothetical protein